MAPPPYNLVPAIYKLGGEAYCPYQKERIPHHHKNTTPIPTAPLPSQPPPL